jgi:hypothetical protein
MTAPIGLPFPAWNAKPVLGEPAHGYFNILVEAEFHTSARVYAQEIEMNGRDLVPEEFLHRLLLLPLADEHKESLRRWTPIWDGRFHHVSGETLRARQMSFTTRRFCRACLAESPRHRVWWDFVHFRVCPLHSRELEATTSSGRRLGWWWPSVVVCPDGEDLRSPAPPHNETDGLEHYLLQRLGAHDGESRPMLDGIPLHEVFDVSEAVGRFLGNPLLPKAPPRSAEDCRAGFRALRATSEHLEREFQRWILRCAPEADRHQGLRQGLGWMSSLNEKHSCVSSSLWPTVEISLRRAFARVGRIGRGYQRHLDLPHSDRTMKEVAAHLGRPVVGLRAIAVQLGIHGTRPGPTGRALLSPKQVDELVTAVEDMISTKAAGELLGCAQVCVRRLVHDGTLAGYTGTKLFGTEGKGSVVRKTEVLALLDRIEAVRAPVATPQVSRGFAQHVKKTGMTEGQLLGAVLKGGIELAGQDARVRGIGSWRFALPNESYGKDVVKARKNEITVLEAQATSGFNQSEFLCIVRAGLVGKVRTRNRTSILSRMAFDDFNRRYVNARLFMDRLGSRERHLVKDLAAVSVPRQFTNISTFSMYIVERRDLEIAIGRIEDCVEPPIWQAFRQALKDCCPTFAVPAVASGTIVRGYLSTRATFLEFRMEDRSILVSKSFSPKAPREWRVFRKFESSIRKDWSMFTWTQDSEESIRAEVRIACETDVALVVPALAAFLFLFRNRRRLPQG